MVRLMILASLFAAAAVAKRIATKPAQKQEIANGIAPGVVPASVQMVAPLRSAVMPRQSAPVGMAVREAGYPGKYVAPVNKDWEGLDTKSKFWMNTEDEQDADLALEEVAVADAEAAITEVAEKEHTFTLNVRQAYDSLTSDIPQILALNSNPMSWGIYTDNIETDFTNPVNPAALGMFRTLFAAAAPSWLESIKGKDAHDAVLLEERILLDKFAEGPVQITGQDWSRADDDAGWIRMIGDSDGKLRLNGFVGNSVIESPWKTDLKLKPALQEKVKKYLPGDGETLDATVTVQAVSKFHLNDEGKIYRHEIDQLDILLNKESMKPDFAELLLIKLADARGKK